MIFSPFFLTSISNSYDYDTQIKLWYRLGMHCSILINLPLLHPSTATLVSFLAQSNKITGYLDFQAVLLTFNAH